MHSHVFACIRMYSHAFACRDDLAHVLNTCIAARGRYTSSESAKYIKYMHDTRANKMEEGHDTIHVQKRAIHDDTQFGGKPTLHLGGNHPLSPYGTSISGLEIYCNVRTKIRC